MLTKNRFFSASCASLLAGSLLLAAGCSQDDDRGPTTKGDADEPATPRTRGVREGSPPSGMRQNPAQPKSKRPGSPD